MQLCNDWFCVAVCATAQMQMHRTCVIPVRGGSCGHSSQHAGVAPAQGSVLAECSAPASRECTMTVSGTHRYLSTKHNLRQLSYV